MRHEGSVHLKKAASGSSSWLMSLFQDDWMKKAIKKSSARGKCFIDTVPYLLRVELD